MSGSEQSTRPPVVTPARVIAAICVVAPFVAVLWVPIYDKDKPEVGGFPFFFWWQLLWVAITAGLMGLAYYVVHREDLARKGSAGAAVATTTATAANVDGTADTGTAENVDGFASTGAAGETEAETPEETDTPTTEEGDAE